MFNHRIQDEVRVNNSPLLHYHRDIGIVLVVNPSADSSNMDLKPHGEDSSTPQNVAEIDLIAPGADGSERGWR